MDIYVVKPGDTVYKIANMFSVNPQRIIADNGISTPNELVIGQALLILPPKTVYTVIPGDTLFSISQRNNISIMSLLQNNPILIKNGEIYPGQTIVISYGTEKSRSITTNGYCYTYINRNVLLSTLPYLSRITIFSYGFTLDGELIEPGDDETIINLALQFDTMPVMLISSITEEGKFSSEKATALFNDRDLQNTLINKILDVMKTKGYMGLDIDFEYVESDDRDAYTEFVTNVTNQLNAEGFEVNVDLAPKTSATQKGTLYEGHDYRALGSIADTVLIMSYEWGYTYLQTR